MPAAEFRDATVTDWVASRSSGAFCSIWNHAVKPPPRPSLPRTPKFDDGACTSAFDIEGTATACVVVDTGATPPGAAGAWLQRAVKPSRHLTRPTVGETV